MVTIGEIMTKDVATVEPEMSLREAMEVLVDAEASGAPVVASGRVVGVLSVTDIMDIQSTTSGAPVQREDQAQRGEWESANLWREDLADVPPTYFADYWDDAGADVRERFAQSESPEWDVMEEHTVGEAMTRQVVGLPPDATAREAARLLTANEIHRVLVMKNDRLEGILTTTDLVRALAEGRIGEEA